MFTDKKYIKELLTALSFATGSNTLYGSSGETQYVRKEGLATPTVEETRKGVMSYELYTFLKSINKITGTISGPVDEDDNCFGTILYSHWN